VPARTSHALLRAQAYAARERRPKHDDCGIKVFNVVVFGMIAMVADVRFATRAACWPLGLLASSDADWCVFLPLKRIHKRGCVGFLPLNRAAERSEAASFVYFC
jgi:hypothetical protein